jgi:hypothetical protein
VQVAVRSGGYISNVSYQPATWDNDSLGDDRKDKRDRGNAHGHRKNKDRQYWSSVKLFKSRLGINDTAFLCINAKQNKWVETHA